ncbi:MAG: non-heme iron oxygenase ferredoxin subunit [Anaerolineae bacterium]
MDKTLNYTPVARTGDIKNGQVKQYAFGSHRIVLANVEDTYFATQDLCTHDGGPLGEGEVFDHEIECPRHGARFDLRTGEVIALPAMFPIKTFPVKVEGDLIQVALD